MWVVSHRTIERLVEAGLLKCEQVNSSCTVGNSAALIWMPNPFAGLLNRLHRTGKLILQGGCAEDQLALLLKMQEMIMPGIMSEGSG